MKGAVDKQTEAVFARLYKAFQSTLNAGDAEGWVDLWTEDGIQMPPGSPNLVGREEMLPAIKEVMADYTYNMNIDIDEIIVAGDWAIGTGQYTADMVPTGDAEGYFIDGKYLTLFKRQPDESWKIYRDIFNSNVP